MPYCATTLVTPRVVWDYQCADFSKACDLLDDVDWDSVLASGDVNRCVLNWQSVYLGVMCQCTCIPKRAVSGKRTLP